MYSDMMQDQGRLSNNRRVDGERHKVPLREIKLHLNYNMIDLTLTEMTFYRILLWGRGRKQLCRSEIVELLWIHKEVSQRKHLQIIVIRLQGFLSFSIKKKILDKIKLKRKRKYSRNSSPRPLQSPT